MALTRDQILAADDRSETKLVPVPEWGGEVQIGILSGTDRDAYELALIRAGQRGSQQSIRALLASMAIVNDKGEKLFKQSDVIALGKKSGKALFRVYKEALLFNALDDAAVDEMAGNSSSGQSDDSGTSLPENEDSLLRSASDES